MRQAYSEMGVSILSGTLTTAGCGIFLFGGDLIVYHKFGKILISTVVMSFYFSMIVFGSLAHTFGPQNGYGDFKFRLPNIKFRKNTN